MNKQLLISASLMLFGVFISSIAQVLLKKATQQKYDSVIKEYLNVRVIAAYIIFFGATFLSLFAYRTIPLSMGAILEASGYIWVTIFSVTMFHEEIGLQKIVALFMILVGIAVYSLLG